MQHKFTIKGRLSGLNEYTSANRTNPHKGNKMKLEAETIIMWSIREQLKRLHIEKPIFIEYFFFEPNKKRDLDNISAFAHKVIQDSLVKTNVLKNDGWGEITGFRDYFFVDKTNPRIEVLLTEVGD